MRTRTIIAIVLALALTVLLQASCASDTGTDTDPTNVPSGPMDSGTGTGTPNGRDMNQGISPPDANGTLEEDTILIHNFAFAPSTIQVEAGDVVTFMNGDDEAHEVEIDGENIGRMEHGASITWTAGPAGTYTYICPLHPQMTGTIVVQ